MFQKIRPYLLAASCSALLSTTAARGATEKDIFFCTKDLDALQSSPASITGSNLDNPGTIDDMQAYFPLENDAHTIFNLRHCFVAFAKVEKKVDQILRLTQVNTYGYGANPNPAEYQKTGDAYREVGLDKKVVSCVPVFESAKLQPGEIYDKWSSVMRIMDEETDAAHYNTIGHNCCSVAYHAVEKSGGNLSAVDPSCFNLKGMGIIWGQTIGNITDYLTVSTFNGMTFLATFYNFSSSSSEPSQEKSQKEREEL
jgi:hypothetical protein